ncbi:MAG: hypothetical protein K5985_11590 [Lachnospiraceae bacterium]|nr:hypothetical protein [Lachnospiraceae bacterium]
MGVKELLKAVKKKLSEGSPKKIPYAGFSDLDRYMKEHYGNEALCIDPGKSLDVNSETMLTISGRSTKNCSLVAITRLLFYYKEKQGLTGIKGDIFEIYREVEEIGKRYGYRDKRGTNPVKIDNITKEAFRRYGYKAKCRGVYSWEFETEVKQEIDESRPVIMNLARGYYKDHTISVVGYSVWQAGNKKLPVIKVVDGWNGGYYYIDYTVFCNDMRYAGIGSFNTARVISKAENKISEKMK